MSRNEKIPSGPTGDSDDVGLMCQVATGDMAAFERIVERHQALVAGTVARMLGNNADVEDIAQQVFIRVWRSAKRYQPKAKFTTWLLTITRNLVFNELRRRRRHVAVSLQADNESEERPLPDDVAKAPDATLLQRELQKAIEEAIDRLPEVQRMALILRRFEELSYEDIADVLDLTVPAVKSVLFRARTELRERLASYLSP